MNRESEAKLTISEPWDQSKILMGRLEETVSSEGVRLLFTSTDNNRYIISLRYKESNIDDIWKGKHVVVNIEGFSDQIDLSPSEQQSLFGGAGSIELIM